MAHGVTIAFSSIVKTCFTKARMSHLSDPKQYPAEEGEILGCLYFFILLYATSLCNVAIVKALQEMFLY